MILQVSPLSTRKCQVNLAPRCLSPSLSFMFASENDFGVKFDKKEVSRDCSCGLH